MFYSSDPQGLREFIKDKLGFDSYDMGDGWLIFNVPEADMGVHPADDTGQQGAPSGTHDISFYCDDIHETVAELKAKGVGFKGDVQEEDWGFTTFMKCPGDFYVHLYQPKYGKG